MTTPYPTPAYQTRLFRGKPMNPSETALHDSMGLGVAGLVFAYLTATNFYKINNFRRMDVSRIRDPLMWAFNHPLVVSDTCIGLKTRPPMGMYKISLVLTITSLVFAYQLYSGAIVVKDSLKGHLF
jgi:hypothetical protein